VAYRIDPIIPFQGSDEFNRLSPLPRIPVLIYDQVTLADSTVIAKYLDERYGTPGLFPNTPAARARARWIEEFADTRIGDVFIWRLLRNRCCAFSIPISPRGISSVTIAVFEAGRKGRKVRQTVPTEAATSEDTLKKHDRIDTLRPRRRRSLLA
jgi:glutathione S-transferase